MTVNVVLMRLRKKSLPVASLEETTEPDEETGGPRKDVGAPDLRLSGAVDRVNLETFGRKTAPRLPDGLWCCMTSRDTSTTRLRTSWDVRLEIRSRSCTRLEPVCASCSRKMFVSRRGKNGTLQKLRRRTTIELQCAQLSGVQAASRRNDHDEFAGEF